MENKKQVKLYLGDNMESLRKLPDNSVDSVVSDPPYGLSFMNKRWDIQVPSVEFWKEVYRVLKPGGHVLSFGGTRTYHRMVVNIEDAGFEIRDQIMWIYGSGFPKSHNIGKSYDKKVGIDIPKNKMRIVNSVGIDNYNGDGTGRRYDSVNYKSKNEWEGWGTALKPANEPICVARKPLSEKTIVDNVIRWGVGGINIDGCRIKIDGVDDRSAGIRTGNFGDTELTPGGNGTEPYVPNEEGRFPANIIFDEAAAAMLDEQTNIEKKHITNKRLCGIITEKKKVDGILDGVKKEIEKYTQNAEQYISGRKLMEDYQKDMRYTISTLTKQMIELRTYNVLQEQNIEDYMLNLIKTILLLMEKSIEDVKSVENIKNYMTSIKSIESMLDFQVIVNVVQEKNLKNGEIITENTIMNTTENIGNSTSRFFYVPKVGKRERNMGLGGFEDKIIEGRDEGQDELNVAYKKRPTPQKNFHPTLKPINLMNYLCRLVTPPGGIVLDPFMGSGSTGISACLEGFRFVGMELDEDYFKIAEARIGAFEEYRPLLKQ